MPTKNLHLTIKYYLISSRLKKFYFFNIPYPTYLVRILLPPRWPDKAYTDQTFVRLTQLFTHREVKSCKWSKLSAT